jgi:hypothetical protein
MFPNLIKKKKVKDVDLVLVGLGNTRLSTIYAQKPPWTLVESSPRGKIGENELAHTCVPLIHPTFKKNGLPTCFCGWIISNELV